MFEDGLFHWLLRLALAGRIWLLVLEPPCTTFSIARSPKLRSSSEAEGFEPIEYETLQGNLFFMMCTLLALAQYAAGNDCLFEQPATGFSKFSCFWLLLLGAGFDSLVTPFCGYLPRDGLVYRKDTVFAHIGAYWKGIIKRCTCVVPHTRLEGSLTTQASAYPDALCRRISRIAKDNFPGGDGPWGHLFGAERGGDHGRESTHAVGGGPRRRIRGSDLFGVILSECLPWSVILKHPFKKHGHINIQEARAYKSLLRRVPCCRRFVVAQDSQVNLAVEAKGRSSSIALNRVVSQTAVETVGRELYPKAYHTPTWSLRADAPSRNRQIERPRCCWPPWLWDLAAGSESRTASAVAALDALPEVSKAELRWVHWTLSLASDLGLLLGVGRCSAAASAGHAESAVDQSGADRCAVVGAPDDSGSELRRLGTPPVAGGIARDVGSERPASAVAVDARVWFLALRSAEASSRFERFIIGDPGRLWLEQASPFSGLESGSHVGETRARGDPSSDARGCFSSLQSRGVGMGVASSSDSIVVGLFRLIETSRVLRVASIRYFDSHRSARAGNSHQARKGKVLVSNGKRAVRESRRAERLRVLHPFSQQHEWYNALMAGVSVGLRTEIRKLDPRGDVSARSIHASLTSDRWRKPFVFGVG